LPIVDIIAAKKLLPVRDDVYLCPAGEQLTNHYTNEEDGKTLRRYWTNACQDCALKTMHDRPRRRISRLEHEAVLEAVEARLRRSWRWRICAYNASRYLGSILV
jgi:hypothetical protein